MLICCVVQFVIASINAFFLFFFFSSLFSLLVFSSFFVHSEDNLPLVAVFLFPAWPLHFVT